MTATRKIIGGLQRKLSALRLELRQAKAARPDQHSIDASPIDVDAAAGFPQSPAEHQPSLEQQQLERIVSRPGAGAGAGEAASRAAQEGQGPQRSSASACLDLKVPREDDEPPRRRSEQEVCEEKEEERVVAMPPEVALGLAVAAAAEARRGGRIPPADGDGDGDVTGDNGAGLGDTARREQEQGRQGTSLAGPTSGGPGALGLAPSRSSFSSAASGGPLGSPPQHQHSAVFATDASVAAAAPVPMAGVDADGGGNKPTWSRGPSPELQPPPPPPPPSASSSCTSPEPASHRDVRGGGKNPSGPGLEMITEASAKLLELEEGRRIQVWLG